MRHLKAFLVIGAAGAVLAAQTPQKPIHHDVAVTLKLVQVYVSDKSGAAVKDLEKKDFVLLEDGEEKAITEFERHVLDPALLGREKAPVETRLLPTPLAPAARLGRKFFLFFDFAYNTPMGILRAKKAALRFIEANLLPMDEVGVVSCSALKGLVMNEPLTLDHAKAAKTVSGLALSEIVGAATDVEWEYQRQLENRTSNDESDYEWERQESKTQARNYLANMTSLVTALGYVQGRKQILLFSSGVPASLLQGATLLTKRTLGFDTILLHLNDEMRQAALKADCVFFVLDTRGNETDLFALDKASAEDQKSIVFRPFESSLSVITPEALKGTQTLRDMAFSTGGQYFGDVRNYEEAFDDLQSLTGTYYVLGYPINERIDGRFHKIKVKVLRKGCQVHTQAGYYNPKSFRDFSDLEKKLHLFDLALSDKPMFQVPDVFPLLPLAYEEAGSAYLRLESLLPSAIVDKFAGRKVEIVALAFDEKDRLAGLQRTTPDLAKHRGRDIHFAAGMAASAGAFVCRIVMRDLETGAAAVASAKAYVPAPSARGLRLGTPLLLAPVVNAVMIESAGKKGREIERWRSVYPYDRARWAPCPEGIESGTAALRALIPYAWEGGAPSGPKLSAHLVDSAKGNKIGASVAVLMDDKKEARGSWLVGISFDDVPAGRYVLYFHASDPVTGATAYSRVPLTVSPARLALTASRPAAKMAACDPAAPEAAASPR